MVGARPLAVNPCDGRLPASSAIQNQSGASSASSPIASRISICT